MPAQKRPLPSPTPDDSAWAPRVAVRHTAASGDGGRGGASHEMDGEASARQERLPHRHRGPRDGGEMNDAAPVAAPLSLGSHTSSSVPWVMDVPERFRLCLGGFADPDDKEVGGCGGGDGTDTNGESSLSPSAGSMEE
jgi:hypothetical protein